MSIAKKNLSLKVVSFWIAFAIITVIFIFVFADRLMRVTTFDSMDDVSKAGLMITGDPTSKNEDTYYVYIYSQDSNLNLEKRTELEPSIFSYCTYVAKNSSDDDVIPLYVYNVDNHKSLPGYDNVYTYLSSLNSNIKASNMPMLVEVSSGSISSTFTTINNIESELQSQKLS